MSCAPRRTRVAITLVFTYPYGDFLLGVRETGTLPPGTSTTRRGMRRVHVWCPRYQALALLHRDSLVGLHSLHDLPRPVGKLQLDLLRPRRAAQPEERHQLVL